MVAAVKHGAGQLVEAGIEQHEVIFGYLFDCADLGQQDARIAGEVSPRLNLQPDLVADDALDLEPGFVPGRVVSLDVGWSCDCDRDRTPD